MRYHEINVIHRSCGLADSSPVGYRLRLADDHLVANGDLGAQNERGWELAVP